MRYLHYPLYRRGRCGFSNLMMSMEVGVIAAFLLDRVLVIEGNVTPPANLATYPGRSVTTRTGSRVTDLVDLPVPWLEDWQIDYDPALAEAMSRRDVVRGVFPWPPDSDLSSPDFLQFAGARRNILIETEAVRAAPVVRLFPAAADGEAGENFGFYSYFFYLDPPARRAVHALLRRMQPKNPYATLASAVSASLVHVRRGDFKWTYGVTTRDRTAADVIRVLDESFARDDLLVILTDDRTDPIFDAITTYFRKSIFIDHHILEHFRREFIELPCHDAIALAYLSQLIAADSLDFVGTMTSTFTSMVQRYRGNRGRSETFKFLWNEIPDPDVRVTWPGSHPPSECVPLHPDGRLVEERAGRYSWMRYHQRLNPAWQREWPESFLDADAMPGRR